MAVYGCIWLYMAVYSRIRLYMAVYGCIYGFVLASQHAFGIPLVSFWLHVGSFCPPLAPTMVPLATILLHTLVPLATFSVLLGSFCSRDGSLGHPSSVLWRPFWSPRRSLVLILAPWADISLPCGALWDPCWFAWAPFVLQLAPFGSISYRLVSF